MAGIFKNLDQSDIRLTPFRAYKRFSGTDAFTTYSAVLDPNAEDLGNNPLVTPSGSDFTTNNKLKNSVWHSIDSQFFRYYYTNAKASFGQLDHTNHSRTLGTNAFVISIPQSNFGEGIEPLSLEITTDVGNVLIDDLYGNVYVSGSSGHIKPTGTTGFYPKNYVFSLKPTNYTRYHNSGQATRRDTKILNESFLYAYDRYQANVQLNNVEVGYPTTNNYNYTALKLNNVAYETSSIAITPISEKVNELYNFTNHDFTIIMYNETGSAAASEYVLVEKKAVSEIIRPDENGNPLTQPIYRYPYKITKRPDGKYTFYKSDGVNTLTYTTTTGSANVGSYLFFTRSGSTYTIIYPVTNDHKSESFIDTLYTNDRYCTNQAPIYVGADQFGGSGSRIEITNLTIHDRAYPPTEHQNLIGTTFNQNLYGHAGIVSRKQGLVVITDPTTALDLTTNSENISNVEYRGTTTIHEKEVSCTISPGEFNFTNNPTAHYYNAVKNQFELADFATGSSFRPYITRIGLYDDNNNLLVVGTLSQPIQPPQNTDTTFILKYDM